MRRFISYVLRGCSGRFSVFGLFRFLPFLKAVRLSRLDVELSTRTGKKKLRRSSTAEGERERNGKSCGNVNEFEKKINYQVHTHTRSVRQQVFFSLVFRRSTLRDARPSSATTPKPLRTKTKRRSPPPTTEAVFAARSVPHTAPRRAILW